MHPQMESLRRLPPAEKLQIVEELWDDIAASGEPPPMTDVQRAEVSRRVAELDADPSIAIDEDELWRRVEQRDA